MDVFAPGTLVRLSAGEVEAVVLVVQISGDPASVLYKVAWWVGAERRESWVDSREICRNKSIPMGFRIGLTGGGDA